MKRQPKLFPLPSAQAVRVLERIQTQLHGVRDDLSKIPDLLANAPDSKPIPVHALPHPQLKFLHPPVQVTVFSNATGDKWRAQLLELNLSAHATRAGMAVTYLLQELVKLYLQLESRNDLLDSRWVLIQQIVGRFTPADRPSLPPPVPPSHEAPTLRLWAKHYSPKPSIAWREGAHARLQLAIGQPEPPSRYRREPYLSRWQAGYDAMSGYLEAGGLIACGHCHQILQVNPTPAPAAGVAPS